MTDAGDAVSGATVSVKGHTTLPGSGTGETMVTATAPTYEKLSQPVKL